MSFSCRMELYRYVTGVLHRFNVEPAPGDTLVGIFFIKCRRKEEKGLGDFFQDHVKSSLGVISTPSSFKVRFSPRAE